jgi:integrase/recombinase XerD
MAERDTNPNPVLRSDMLAEDRRLIREFFAHTSSTTHTKHRYATQLGEFSVWLTHERTTRKGSGGLLSATRADVVRFAAYLSSGDRYAASEKVLDPSRVLSDSARKNYLSAIKSMYDYLLLVELVDVDPTRGVKRPKVRTRPGLKLTAVELRAFLDAPGSPRSRIVGYLLAYTACRLDEIRNLRWRDVDFEAQTLLIHGKGDKYRALDIHPRLMPELRRWRLREDHRAQHSATLRQARMSDDTDFVLLSRTGTQLSGSAIAKQVKRRATAAGLYVKSPKHNECRSAISPHVLRRTFATLLLNDGHHLDAVADVLGHSSVDTTRKHYAFTSNARRRATIEGFQV